MLFRSVLRMIPAFTRKARQIILARRAIGKGAEEKLTEKAKNGAAILSALTDWALEGSIITADSMRSRGYGTGKRTNFQIYSMTSRARSLSHFSIMSAVAPSSRLVDGVAISRLSSAMASSAIVVIG